MASIECWWLVLVTNESGPARQRSLYSYTTDDRRRNETRVYVWPAGRDAVAMQVLRGIGRWSLRGIFLWWRSEALLRWMITYDVLRLQTMTNRKDKLECSHVALGRMRYFKWRVFTRPYRVSLITFELEPSCIKRSNFKVFIVSNPPS